MHVLFLTSGYPKLGHSQAYDTVLAALMVAVRDLGHRVSYAVVAPHDPPDPETVAELAEIGIACAGDLTGEVVTDNRSRPERLLDRFKDIAAPDHDRDYPRFRDPGRSAARLAAVGADVAILFWDSWFEHLVPALTAPPVVGYLARPRFAAPLIRLELGFRPSGPLPEARVRLARRTLMAQRERHFARTRHLAGRTNICALDAAMYRERGQSCTYVPNAWPDAFGPDWQMRRQSAEASAGGFSILGAFSALQALGNLQGLSFWSREVLPRLADLMTDREWSIAICGRGWEALPADLRQQLTHPHVDYKGFVPDIDAEMLANSVFLLCNTAGPYTGGYTRVAYAMSAGACLIGHAGIADSMPEIVDGENALLGTTGEEIAGHIVRVREDPRLRARISEQARLTYERSYAPREVAKRLLAAAGEAIGGLAA